MKNIFTKALLIASMTLFSVLPMAAQALGTSCENPYIVTKEFNTAISEPGSYWFSVTTYDLPLRVRYTPDVPTDEKMMAYVDFSCTPGVYDDPNLYELTDVANGWGIEMPIGFGADSVQVDGQITYEIMVDEVYRSLMTSFGILYEVEAKVNVQIPQPGVVAVIPDTVFRQTIESCHWVELPDTINVGVETKDSIYIIPFGDWSNDSIQVEWLGEKYAAEVWIASNVNFKMDDRDVFVIDHFTLEAENGKNIKEFQRAYIEELLNNLGAGMFYAKIIAAEDAQIVFARKPMSPEMARAIPMELNKAVEVKANDADQYYYFRKDWSKNDLTFQAQGTDAIVAYFGTTPTFETAIAQYTFSVDGKKSVLNLSSKQLSIIANACATDHIFVRFATLKGTQVTPVVWNIGECVSNSIEILPNSVTEIPANSKNNIYSLNYNKWCMYDVVINWVGGTSNKIYLADTCSGFKLSSTDPHVLLYKSMKANSSLSISAEELHAWSDRVDADGYLYFRFDTRGVGDIQTISTIDSAFIPVEPDLPAVPTTECSLSSLPLAQGDQVVLNLDSAFTVYRIDYKAWLKSGATLTWGGVEPLHTFVAETCAFALAPYNRYVLAYIPVPAQGNIVLDTNQLAAMEEYVSEDGFLYIRFLTKEEGVLEVK